jgi:transposase
MATTAGNNSSSWPTFITLLGRLSKADTSARQTHNAGRDSPRAGFVLTAHVLVAEIGVDMARFPTAGHLLSWATMCPRNDESADKRRSRRTCKGGTVAQNPPGHGGLGRGPRQGELPAAPVPAPQSSPQRQKAILAVAASVLTAAWHMLKDRVEYKDHGADHFARCDRSKVIQRLVRRLKDLGCKVELTAEAA